MDKRIIVIGAGASGIAAATELVSNGFKNVTILEAGNRIGGRINTIPFGANVVDLGAQWCHGEKGNVVYELAKDKDVLIHAASQPRDTFIRSNGEVVSNEVTDKIFGIAHEIYDGAKYQLERDKYQGSFANFFALKYKEALSRAEFKDVDAELAHECYEFFHKRVNLMEGTNSWYDASCDPHEYEGCEGDPFLNWKDKGYITIFELLQNKIPGGRSSQPVVDIIPFTKFNKEVRKIAYSQLNDQTIKVECIDGTFYHADHLICTVSLGVLKERHLSMFEPLLPLWKIHSISGMEIGTIDKIYLEFEKPFWNANWEGFSILWKLDQLKEIREDPVNGDWIEGLMGFYPFNPLQPNVICGWINGYCAQKMEQKSDKDVKMAAEKVLRMFVTQWKVPDSKAMVRSKWHSNPLFRGSITSYTLEAEALGASVANLAKPVTNSNGIPVLQFAGEGTSPKHFSNVHGAVESGWREAQRLIQLYS